MRNMMARLGMTLYRGQAPNQLRTTMSAKPTTSTPTKATVSRSHSRSGTVLPQKPSPKQQRLDPPTPFSPAHSSGKTPRKTTRSLPVPQKGDNP